jgi:hypothetical protein
MFASIQTRMLRRTSLRPSRTLAKRWAPDRPRHLPRVDVAAMESRLRQGGSFRERSAAGYSC